MILRGASLTPPIKRFALRLRIKEYRTFGYVAADLRRDLNAATIFLATSATDLPEFIKIKILAFVLADTYFSCTLCLELFANFCASQAKCTGLGMTRFPIMICNEFLPTFSSNNG